MDDTLLKIIAGSITALFATIVAILLYVLNKKDDELTLVKNKISDEKYKTYFSIVLANLLEVKSLTILEGAIWE